MKPLSRPSRALLAAARPAEDPSVADRDRVRRRLLAAAALGGAALASATSASAASASAAGAVAASKQAVSAAASKSAIGVLATPGLVKAIVIGALLGLGTVSTAELLSNRDSAPPPPRAVAAATVAPALPAPQASLAAAPPAEAPSAEPAPARPEARPLQTTAASPTVTAAPAATLREEVEILKEAQRAIRSGDTERAMTLLDSHEKKFSGGSLKEERLAARAIALCQAGRGAEAQRAAAQFFAQAGASPLEGRVREACKGMKGSDPGQ